MTVILASSSPRRAELMRRLNIPFEVIAGSVKERDPATGEDPVSYALELAQLKAADVAGSHPADLVLGADTVVVLDDHILNKPLTAVVVRRGPEERAGTVSADVEMRHYTDEEIARYVATGEPMDKAGAYAVQGLGGALVAGVEGCYDTVVGLPLCLVTELLSELGLEVARAHRHTGAEGMRVNRATR